VLHPHERLVHVGDVHAGAHVLLGEVLQAAALCAGHLGRVATRGVRTDELAERALEHGHAEAVERRADALQKMDVGAEL
jgi:hypothetical protein